MKCKKCGAELIDGAKFCGECGTLIDTALTKKCKYCGTELPIEATFCGGCGKPLEDANQSQEPEEKKKTVLTGPVSEKQIGLSTKVKVIIGVAVLIIMVVLALVLLNPGKDNNTPFSDNSATSDHTETNVEEYTPESVEEYAPESGGEVLKLVKSGYTVTDSEDNHFDISYGVEVKNVSDNTADKALTVNVAARDSEGKVIDTGGDGFTISIPAGETFGVGGVVYYLKKKPETVEISISYDPTLEFEKNRTLLSSSDVRIDKIDEYTSNIVGDIVNESGKELAAGSGFVIYKDTRGNIVGGDSFHVESIKKGKTPFSNPVFSNTVVSDQFEIYTVGYDR